jgi:hypothetical protein
VGSEDYHLYAIHPDGTLKWAFQTGSWIISSPAIGSDGTIYVGSFDEHLYAFGRTDDTAVENPNHGAIPKVFALQQNFPNPFNASTTIRYQLPQTAHLRLSIYNILGQEVRAVVDDVQPAGFYAVTWDGTDENRWSVASGIYLYSIQTGEFRAVKKALLLR